MKKLFGLKGSITVEASFVVPICLIGVITVMYFSFFITDEAIATGIIRQELAKCSSFSAAEEMILPKMKENILQSLEKSLVGVSEIKVNCTNENGKIRVVFEGNVRMPIGFIPDMKCVVRDEKELLKQVDFIRDIRRVADLI